MAIKINVNQQKKTTLGSKGVQGRFVDDFNTVLELPSGDDFDTFSQKVGPGQLFIMFLEDLFPRVVISTSGDEKSLILGSPSTC